MDQEAQETWEPHDITLIALLVAAAFALAALSARVVDQPAEPVTCEPQPLRQMPC